MPEKPPTVSETVSVVVLQGDDVLAKGDVLSELTARYQSGGWGEMNTVHLDGSSVTRGELSNAVNALPLGSSKRLVILRDALDFASDKETQTFLLQTVAHAPDSTQLILAFDDSKKYGGGKMRWQHAGDGHWLRKALKKSEKESKWLEFSLPSDREMAGWINTEAKRQGGKFEGAAAAELARLIGSNTLQARHEITKALNYIDDGRDVTRADVLLLCTPSAEEKIFDMIDAMSERDGRAALLKYNRLIDHANPQFLLFIFGLVARQVRLLIITREVLDAGGKEQDVQSATGSAVWLAKKLMRQSRRFRMPELLRIYRRLDRMDEAGKTGRGTLAVRLESLIAEISR